jgi:hypothetical protein
MNREEAEGVLDDFLFRNIQNHYSEDEYAVTWVGMNFAVLERATGRIETFKVQFTESDLSPKRWVIAFTEQEWYDD